MSTALIEQEVTRSASGAELPDGPQVQVEVDVLDEDRQELLTFSGRDAGQVDELIQRWSDTGEQTWLRSRPATLEDGSTLDDLARAI